MDKVRLELQNYLGVSGVAGASIALQFFIIIAFLVWFYIKFVKESPAEKPVRGILFFLTVLWMTAEVFSVLRLRILSALLKNLILLIMVSFVVIFQPELRRLMTRIGNSLNRISQTQKRQITNQMIDVLSQSIEYWQKHKIGVLIVFENQDPILPIATGGVILNAKLSPELLINLFYKNTPLHDGAVIIKDGIISAAGVVLPLSRDAELNWKYGTRHRAAIGVSENTDALVIVVSEESGDVSLVRDGQIHSFHGREEWQKRLTGFFAPLMPKGKTMSVWGKIKELIKS